MANQFVQVPPNSTGLKMQTFENVVGANTVESEAVTLVRSSDNTEVGTTAQPLRVDPTGTTTQPVSGTVSVTSFANPLPVTLTSTTITGTVAENLTQVAGTTLGATAVTNFGTAPSAAAVPGVNASLFIGTTVATAATAGVQLVGIEGRAGTSLETTAGVIDHNLKNVGNTAVVTAGIAGVQKVGVIGGSGQAIDAAASIGTAPVNGVLTLVNYLSNAPPSLSTGQTIGAQCDTNGSLFVKPYRRSQTTAQATTITNSSTATTVLAAQAAGVFADISYLNITVLPVATTAITFTATLSDGTRSFVYHLSSGVSPATGTYHINSEFNPPLPATTAAVAWTVALSVATVTVAIKVVAVLQKAS
jgi:hypothetical protein